MVVKEWNEPNNVVDEKYLNRNIKFNVENVLGALNINSSWDEYEPTTLTFRVNRTGNVIFTANYKQYRSKLDFVNNDLHLINGGLDMNSREMKQFGTWLFNLNLERVLNSLNKLQDIADHFTLENIDLLSYIEK